MVYRFADREVDAALRVWLDDYDAIYDEYVAAVESSEVEFGLPHAHEQKKAAVMEGLRSKGALFRNGDASVSANGISSACAACAEDSGSQTFLFSLKCNRSCYFCFNANQEDYERHLVEDRDWRAEFEELVDAGRQLSHVALTGGEPLLSPDETIAFFSAAQRLWPQAHKRLYTTGDMLNEALLDQLVSAGLSEIRFSIKLDDGEGAKRRALERIRMAKSRDLDVMVEMPVIPGTLEEMKALLVELDEIGVFGINLLEFCYANSNWPEFARRGFKVKNPPFPVLYTYSYAGSLPIEGSEVECLELVEFAIDEGLRMGVHYCSLENKHRTQVFEQNHLARLQDSCYELDADDFFLKTVKVFGADALRLRDALARSGAEGWRYDDEDGCIIANPGLLPAIRLQAVDAALSINILEQRENGVVLRELDLKLLA